MMTFLDFLADKHDPFFLLLAVGILTVGSVITMRLFARVRRTDKNTRGLWLILAGLIGGGTIWSTHFVSLVAYKNSITLGYDPVLTGTSLLVIIATTCLGFLVASLTQKSYIVELGGAILGLGISAMHFTGIYAMEIRGEYQWDAAFVIASITLSMIFGAVATSRIARPITRFCRYGGSVSLILAFALMHFISMFGMEVIPSANNDISINLISENILGASVIIVISLLFLVSFITNLIDLKSSEASSNHFKHLALHDALTALPNRLGCEKHLEHLLKNNPDDTASIAVFAIDLDRFKQVNDAHGHAAGDHLLRTISKRISANLKDGEMVGRFGGDEFFAIKEGVYMKREIKAFADRLSKAVDGPIEWKDANLSTSASIGYALYPKDSERSVELMEKADLAMYRAKQSGRNCAIAYDEKMEDANRERVTLGLALADAIANNELDIHYQLQNDTNTREIAGVEALLRWNNPELGAISPGVFIPIAEENGMIGMLGSWVLERACNDAKKWDIPLKVAVNVAPNQLSDPNFPSFVGETLKKTGLPADRLELEITESGIILDMAQALNIILQLKELGVKIAMDDYGTGYSSLATLQNFPFDKIKIDREFVKAIDSNKHSNAIVSSTVILANSLNIPVLAEGVETEEHLKLLGEHGCQHVQGFLFGKPMPNKDLEKIIAEELASPNKNEDLAVRKLASKAA